MSCLNPQKNAQLELLPNCKHPGWTSAACKSWLEWTFCLALILATNHVRNSVTVTLPAPITKKTNLHNVPKIRPLPLKIRSSFISLKHNLGCCLNFCLLNCNSQDPNKCLFFLQPCLLFDTLYILIIAL